MDHYKIQDFFICLLVKLMTSKRMEYSAIYRKGMLTIPREFQLYITSILILFANRHYCMEKNCTSSMSINTALRNASFYTVGFATVHNSLQNTRSRIYGLINSEALLFATEEVNCKVLPQHLHMGTIVFNDCGESITSVLTETTLRYTLDARSWPHIKDHCDCRERALPVTVVGPDNSAGAKYLSELTASSNLPMISYLATSVVMEDRRFYPNFFRTIPTDRVFVQVLMDIVLNYGWSYISLISSDNSYGWYGRHGFLQLLSEHKVCVDLDFLFNVPFDALAVRSFLLRAKEKHQANVFVMFATSELTWEVFRVAEEIEFYDVTWILSDVTSVGEWLVGIDERITHGLIGAVPFTGRYWEFEDRFWNRSHIEGSPWIKNFIKHYPDDWAWLRKHHNLYYPTMLVASYIRNAIFANAYAHKEYFASLTNRGDYKRKDFIQHLANVAFEMLNGEMVHFDEFGNVMDSTFEIISVASNKSHHTDRIQIIGDWSNARGLNLTGNVDWPMGYPPKSFCSQECRPGFYPVYNIGKQCCWVCIQCEHGNVKAAYGNQKCEECFDGVPNANQTVCLKYTLKRTRDTLVYKIGCFMALVLVVSSLTVIGLWTKSRGHAILKASNYPFSMIQLLLHFLTGVIIPLIYYMEENDLTCVFRPLFIIALNVGMVSILGVRAESLVMAFKSKIRITQREALITKSISVVYVVGSVLVSLAIAIIVISLDGIKMLQVKYQKTVTMENTCYNNNVIRTVSILIFIQALVCGRQAFRSRNLPDKFCESYCILSCMLGIIVFISTGLILNELKHDYYSRKLGIFVITNIFVNIYILVVMFFPKTWTIVACNRGGLDNSQHDTRLAFTKAVFENAAAPNIDH